MGGMHVRLPRERRKFGRQLNPSQDKKGYAIYPRKSVNIDWSKQGYWYAEHYFREVRTKQPLAFRLPEVSRQIYSETAVLTYTVNTFVLDDGMANYTNWASRLLPAQRNAVVSIELCPAFFAEYAHHTLIM
jgi:hypothetical protein